MDAVATKPKVTPFSLKDAPSLIERVWPAQKISVEAQKERKAGSGQTLTALGSYWKGRKPLILVRACVLAALLPVTGDDEKDLATFELLCGISDDQIIDRFKTALTFEETAQYASAAERAALIDDTDQVSKLKRLHKSIRNELMSAYLVDIPYSERVERLFRPEEISERDANCKSHESVNDHLGTSAQHWPSWWSSLELCVSVTAPRLEMYSAAEDQFLLNPRALDAMWRHLI